MKNDLTKYELELLQEAYLILDKDMTYDQEKEITEKTNSSITDLYELRFKLENMQASKKRFWTNKEVMELIETHIVKDENGQDKECAYNEGLKQVWREFYQNRKALPYPFEEGDTYYTIEQGEVVESCWDDVSEETHDDNPNMRYFETREEAEKDIKKMLDLCGSF